jgi:hypothetical protein
MKTLKTIALVIALAPASGFAQGGGGASLSGTWKVSGDVVGNAVDLVCTFNQDGKKLAGSCRQAGAEKANEIAGEVDDKKVTWKFDSEYEGRKITLTFTGALDASSQLKGGIDVQPFGVSGDFSAKKEEPKKPQP